MARIRTVKPEFWEDETIATLSRDARLLFIATFNLADDEGLMRWASPYIKASAFMYDDDLTITDVESLMAELITAGLVFTYTGGKAQQRLAFIVNFRKHQKINRPQPSRLPAPSIHNRDVRAMYGRRDGWTCNLCTGVISQNKSADDRFNISIDHLVPRSAGGLDYPSNVAVAHQTCNKQRGTRPMPSSLTDSLGDSVNEASVAADPAVNQAVSEGMGRGKGTEWRGSAPSGPLSRCLNHQGVADAPPCRACGDARRAYDAWVREQKNRPTPTAGTDGLEECPDHRGQALTYCSGCAADRKAAS